MESTADEVLDMIGTSQEKEKNVIPEQEPETSPDTPSPENLDPLDSQGDIKLASETFDPEDENFDGGMTS
jgi:hypothetical protein